MKVIDRNISELIPAEYNPRFITDEQLEHLKASIQRFDAVEPIKKAYRESIRRYKANSGEQWKDIKFTCLWCGSHFKSNKAYSKRIPIACSIDCSGELHSDHKVCVNCGNTYVNYQNKYYCSMDCAAEHKRGEPLSKEHREALSESKKGKSIKYFDQNREKISKKISEALTGKPQPWNRGKNHPRWVEKKANTYSHQWRNISENLRHNSTCQRCGTIEQLEVHHIIPYRISESHNKDNLVVLCKSCHQKTEHNNIKAKEILGSWKLLKLAYKLKFEDIGNPIINE